MQDNKEKEEKRQTDTRRNIIIGSIVSKYFPEVLDIQPRRTSAENNIEFAEFEDFVSMLAENKDYNEQLKKRTKQKNEMANSQKRR